MPIEGHFLNWHKGTGFPTGALLFLHCPQRIPTMVADFQDYYQKNRDMLEEICSFRSQLSNHLLSIFCNDPVDVAFYEEELATYRYYDCW